MRPETRAFFTLPTSINPCRKPGEEKRNKQPKKWNLTERGERYVIIMYIIKSPARPYQPNRGGMRSRGTQQQDRASPSP